MVSPLTIINTILLEIHIKNSTVLFHSLFDLIRIVITLGEIILAIVGVKTSATVKSVLIKESGRPYTECRRSTIHSANTQQICLAPGLSTMQHTHTRFCTDTGSRRVRLVVPDEKTRALLVRTSETLVTLANGNRTTAEADGQGDRTSTIKRPCGPVAASPMNSYLALALYARPCWAIKLGGGHSTPRPLFPMIINFVA